MPYIGALIGMVLVSRHSDRTLERRYHTTLSGPRLRPWPDRDRLVREHSGASVRLSGPCGDRAAQRELCVLDHTTDDAVWVRSRRRHRTHQFDRQRLGMGRSLGDRLARGYNWQGLRRVFTWSPDSKFLLQL